jgi:hypothetical protein
MRALVRGWDVPASFRVEGFWPQWKGRWLVGVEENKSREPLLYIVGRDGLREEIRFGLPDAYLIIATGIAAGSDGAIAVFGSAYNNDSRGATFLLWISPDRKNRVLNRVWPYVPNAAAIASDGTIWTAGWVRDGDEVSQRNVVRRFDRSGATLSSFTVRARGWTETSGLLLTQSYMVSSRDRVGWLNDGGEYIEFSLTGTEVDRFDGPPVAESRRVEGIALSEANDLLVGVTGGMKWDIMAFDRKERAWRPVRLSEGKWPHWGRLLGIDGNTLMTTTPEADLCRYTLAEVEPPRK